MIKTNHLLSVKRTHPDIPFFSGDSAFAKANQDSLKAILIVYSKLNPGILYAQGMNEILAPLFYVLKTDPNEDYADNAEADTFFFVLLSDFRDNLCQQLDNSIVGIRSTISRLSQLLKQHDEELWRHLEVTTKVNPQFYAFRWITLLLTQEFNFTDILHIWDMLLSNPVGPRVLQRLLILMRTSDNISKRLIVSALACMCSPRDQKQIFVDHHGLDLLVDQLRSGDSRIRSFACSSLCSVEKEQVYFLLPRWLELLYHRG